MTDKQELETEQPAYLGKSVGSVAALWGIAGTCGLLCMAVSRMWGHAAEAFQSSLEFTHYLVLVPWLGFMLYSEGYKGFQKGFSPRVASRAIYLRDHATWFRLIFAPFFCSGFFASTKKRKIVVWCLLIGISLLVMLFRQIPQPWRGILDAGVVCGLGWGVIATLVFFVKYWRNGIADADPEVR
jgi:hypothetical protein